jgi:hypothetical protein
MRSSLAMLEEVQEAVATPKRRRAARTAEQLELDIHCPGYKYL